MHEGKIVYAHRLAMGLPDGQVGHRCHDLAAADGKCAGGFSCVHRRCVNREHLEIQTAAENLASSSNTRVSRKFWTHCEKGHAFTPENTIIESKGRGYLGRKCRTCKNLRERIR